MKRLFFCLSIISVIVICCKSTQTLAPTPTLAPTTADVTIAQSHWQGTTIDQLKQGYDMFMDKCTSCHGIKNPQDYSEDDWNTIMPKMARKSKITQEQSDLIFHYILAKRESILGSKK
jgi:hypothetical protein